MAYMHLRNEVVTPSEPWTLDCFQLC